MLGMVYHMDLTRQIIIQNLEIIQDLDGKFQICIPHIITILDQITLDLDQIIPVHIQEAVHH